MEEEEQASGFSYRSRHELVLPEEEENPRFIGNKKVKFTGNVLTEEEQKQLKQISENPEETSVKKEPNENEFTGLIKQKFRTDGYIEAGFWMQGEYAAFISKDEANYIYVEVFNFED